MKDIRKINFKQPKYILPLVVFLPLVFLGYTLSQLFGGNEEGKEEGVVTDNINMTLPDAASQGVGSKMDEMSKRFSEDGAYTAIGALGDERESLDSTQSGYGEDELNRIDEENARREQRQKELDDLERSLAESRRHINAYAGGFASSSYTSASSGGVSSTAPSRQEELDGYARELEYIQNRSRARQKMMEEVLSGGSMSVSSDDGTDTEVSNKKEKSSDGSSSDNKNEVAVEKTEMVTKVPVSNAEKFNTIDREQTADEPLIRAMIDKTTKAHEGTRLRFKLLDDVAIGNTVLKKGSYLYGTVTGFGQQRVMASVTSVLLGDRFVKVSLSVFDNDGMEGFYVPESAFRDMMRDAGAQAVQTNMSFDNSGGGLSGEALALQALQNMYQSASSAVSGNIRKNRARIKYNTVVYLVNAQSLSSH